jgi:hypothetical protein
MPYLHIYNELFILYLQYKSFSDNHISEFTCLKIENQYNFNGR